MTCWRRASTEKSRNTACATCGRPCCCIISGRTACRASSKWRLNGSPGAVQGMAKDLQVLFCFAVKEEAGFFRATAGMCVLITGMGRRNAGEATRTALAGAKPGLVITAGFAGGLNPRLKPGDVVFDADA